MLTLESSLVSVLSQCFNSLHRVLLFIPSFLVFFGPNVASCLPTLRAHREPAPPGENFRSKCGSAGGRRRAVVGRRRAPREGRGARASGRLLNLISRREARLLPRWNSIWGDRHSARLRAAHLPAWHGNRSEQAAAGEGGGYYTDTPSDKTGGCAPVDIFVTSGQSRILPESAHTVDLKMEAQCVDKSSSLEVVINSKNTVKPGAI